MDESLDLIAKIQKNMPNLSKGQKKIALFLQNHYDKAIYLTAAKLGETVGVSESTVVRFAIELGFDGYPKLQKELAEVVKNRLTASQRMEVTSDRIVKGNKHILQTVLHSDAERISRTLSEIDEDAFDGAVDEMIQAKRIYIVGGRSSAMIANFFSFYLNLMVDNTINVYSSTSSEVFEQIFRIREGDVFIGISFPRYSQRTIKAIEYASAQNATTIAITDSLASPIAAFANYNLIARCDMMSFVDSMVAPLSLINALLVAISVRKKDELVGTLDKLEQLWIEYNVYSTSVPVKRVDSFLGIEDTENIKKK